MRKAHLFRHVLSTAGITLAILFISASLTGCSDNPVDPPEALSEQKMAVVFSSSEFRATRDAAQELIERTREALAQGANRGQLRQALVRGDAARFYNLIGMSAREVEQLDARYFAAKRALAERFPELKETAASGEATCSATPERKAALFFERVNADSGSTLSKAQAEPLFEGCKKLALGACLVGCAAGLPTVILAELCAYVCYCGLCEGDRGGVCP